MTTAARPILLLDEHRFGPRAANMVDVQLRRRGIVDPRVLDQMRRIPRHCFVNPADVDRAYDDCALPTERRQTISQPYIVALMSQMLAAAPDCRVLEIGTGSGYQTMILAGLCRSVISIERDEELATRARAMMQRFAIANVAIRTADGSLGWPDDAPYDRILVAAAAPRVPDPLTSQLADRGRIVIPVGDRTVQRLVIIERDAARLRQIDGLDVRFVPLIGQAGWPTA
jgi:protein-L-isoaspartate(D-aspartate) O-methyltransferase